MRRYTKEAIIPYKGTETFVLGVRLEDIRKELKEGHIAFNQWTDSNKDCTPPIPWTYIKIEECITLCFVKDILFEVVLEKGYEGKLTNGLYIGMRMEDALAVDTSLRYNDDDEDYVSKEGYWIGDSVESGAIESITVYIPEADDAETFFRYDWISNY